MSRKLLRTRDLPEDVAPETIDTIRRIEAQPSVAGILFVRHNLVHICTVPKTMAQTLVSKLPGITQGVHQALTEIAVMINEVNPVIDRIMEDDSVAAVVMTNKEGAPILTNVSTTKATHYGFVLHKFCSMAQAYIKELDPFDEVIVTRLHTKKVEMMTATHPEFNIIVLQNPRHTVEKKEIARKSN